jgi:hypothetical protein
MIRFDQDFELNGKAASMTALMAYECDPARRNGKKMYDRIAPDKKINNQKKLFLMNGVPGK